MKVRSYLYFFIFIFCSPGCSDDHPGSKTNTENRNTKITIAVAANVQFAMKEIEDAFEALEPGITLNIVIGSSGKLTAQIEQGAPYDLLVSANMMYPESLYAKGMAVTAPRVYAFGTLVIWTMYEELDLSQGVKIFTRPDIRKIALANPRTAPYGEEAIKAFQYFGIYDQIKDKLVFGESIAQTNQYILSKSCNAGITSKSVVLSPQLKDAGFWVSIPEEAYDSIEQGITITKYGAENHTRAAQKFYDFLFSPGAQKILEDYGYKIPGKNNS